MTIVSPRNIYVIPRKALPIPKFTTWSVVTSGDTELNLFAYLPSHGCVILASISPTNLPESSAPLTNYLIFLLSLSPHEINGLAVTTFELT